MQHVTVNEHDPDATNRRSSLFDAPDWWIYRGTGRPMHDIDLTQVLPPPPPWRDFRGGPLPESDVPPADDGEMDRRLGSEFHLAERDVDPRELDMVNAAL